MAGVVITVAQQKGGAGKTTMAAHLAVAFAASRKVSIIDIDPQGSLTAWYKTREARFGVGETGLDFTAVTGWRVSGEVERQARDHDVVLVDSPPRAETEARIAIRAAQLILIPVQPSPLDIMAMGPTLEIARQEKVPVLLVLNRVPPRANLTETMMGRLVELKVPVATTRIGNRVALANAFVEGEGIGESAPGSRADEEVEALAAEVMRRLKTGALGR